MRLFCWSSFQHCSASSFVIFPPKLWQPLVLSHQLVVNIALSVFRICRVNLWSPAKHALHIHSHCCMPNTRAFKHLCPLFSVPLPYFATAGQISHSQHSLSLNLRLHHLIFGPFLLLPAEVPISAICGGIC